MEGLKQEVNFAKIKPFAAKVALQALDAVLEKKKFSTQEATKWINLICDRILQKLQQANSNFKFMVNCIVTERRDCEIWSNGSFYWDKDLDGHMVIQKEYMNLAGMVTIFGVAF